MAFPQSKYAYADIAKPSPWFCCDRCGFRKMKNDAAFQWDFRGLALKNLRLLVCPVCLDNPQPQLKPIIIGPDPIPVKDPRPGFAATQMGVTVPLDLIDEEFFPNPGANGYLTDEFGNLITTDAGIPIPLV